MKKIITLFIFLLAVAVAPLRAEEQNLYTPQMFGVAKVKMELSTNDGEYRFDVRNSRIGVRGNASERMNYAIQIDYNNEGSISILDSWVGYHVEGFAFKLGQQKIQFSTDLDRGPDSSPFSNRSFLSKYITTYYYTEATASGYDVTVKTMSSRDIGARIEYTIPKTTIKLSGGVFNGSGSNNPEWSSTANIVARVDVGAKEGFGAAASCYIGVTPTVSYATFENGAWSDVVMDQKIRMYDAYVRYTKGDLFVEAEYAQRRLNQNEFHLAQAYYIHGTYRFQINDNPIFKYFAPHLRWDAGKNIEYYDYSIGDVFRYSSNRMTYSMNFGLSEKRIKSELRLAYEDYFVTAKPGDISYNKLLQDKFTIEFVAAF
ncbi:MAG: porin [Rikenellaceae bacterium]